MWRYPDQRPPPFQLCLVLMVLMLLLGWSRYINHEPVVEDLMNQLKLVLMVSPVVLLLAVHFISGGGGGGGSPYGVGFLLLFLVLMAFYQASFHDRFFPFLSSSRRR